MEPAFMKKDLKNVLMNSIDSNYEIIYEINMNYKMKRLWNEYEKVYELLLLYEPV